MVVRMALPPWASWRRVATKCMAVVLSNPVQQEPSATPYLTDYDAVQTYIP